MKISFHAIVCLLSWLGVVTIAGCDGTHAADGEGHAGPTTQPATVTVRVIGEDGKLTDPVTQPRLQLTDGQWRQRLGDEQFDVLRGEGTEAPFSCDWLNAKRAGLYVCAGCDLPLFEAGTKFDSRSGWPSYFQPIATENITEVRDASHGMVRTEVECTRCGGHLGHVFDDGPPPTGLRYCINGLSLRFVSDEQRATLAQPTTASVVLAGGCFWCTEAVLELAPGVVDVVSGYAGGTPETANYKAVSAGSTRHAEVIAVTYDPARVSLADLLHVFFLDAHDPTQLNRQGGDVGPQYRSAIFFADDEQKSQAQAVIDELTRSGKFKAPIVTTLEPLTAFHPAEKYHQDYARLNPVDPYVRAVAAPKVEKYRAKHAKP